MLCCKPYLCRVVLQHIISYSPGCSPNDDPAGAVDIILSYCHYSLNDTTLGDLIPYLQVRERTHCRSQHHCTVLFPLYCLLQC